MIERASRRGSRETVLGAAMDCFLQLGFENTSMEAVAQRADVARQTVFNNFESKEALFAAAVERLWQQLPVLETLSDPACLADPEAGLRRLGREISDFLARPEFIPLLRLVIAEGGRFPFLRQDFSRFGREPAIDVLARYLHELDRRRVLDVPDAGLAALQFIALVKDVLWWPAILGIGDAPTPPRREQVIEAAAAMIARRYARRGRP